MDGIEILKTQEIAIKSPNWIMCFINSFIVVVIFVIIVIALAKITGNTESLAYGFMLAIFIGIFVFPINVGATAKPIKYETQYKIIISDDVKLNEFMDKYEILDQEGKIYTVRER